MKHVMVDIEVLGVIASIGAVEFDSRGVHTQFYRVIDQTSALLAGLLIDRGSIDFWRKQDASALGPLLNSGSKVSLKQALEGFAGFVDHNTWLWAKGPDYDCIELKKCYDACGMQVPWSFRNMRDVRTIMALSGVVPAKAITKHDALCDASAQATTVLAAYSKLGLTLP